MEREEIAERAALVNFLLDASGIEADAAGIDGEVGAVEAQGAGDDVAGADELADANDRRLAEGSIGRQVAGETAVRNLLSHAD